jgi:hypothetical protein
MRLKRSNFATFLCALTLSLPVIGLAQSAETDVEAAMVKVAAFFRDELSVEGSYVWKYNASNLAERGAEGKTTPSQGWTEPPGTPAVGLAYLAAFKATGQQFFLDASLETARALIRTQLESGGWRSLLEFDPEARQSWCYRVDEGKGRPDCGVIEGNNRKNSTSPDDNKSQSSLMFLIRLDDELGGRERDVREAAIYGLDKFADAQYPNGAWPHRLDKGVLEKLTSSAARSSYPEDWSRSYVKPKGELYLTNDHLVRDVVRMFLLAHNVYGDPAYLAAARRGGEFLLSAQMPEPQPGWAQIYNGDLQPIWGRPFEPPSIASNETAGSIQALLELYQATGKARYLDGAELAALWLERSRLPDDDWARFYELETNKPLYVDHDYQITYSDDDLPDHYIFVGQFGIETVLEAYKAVADNGGVTADQTDVCRAPDQAEVSGFIEAMDKKGRWVEEGTIESGTFVKRLAAMACFLAAQKGETLPDYIAPIRHQLDR